MKVIVIAVSLAVACFVSPIINATPVPQCMGCNPPLNQTEILQQAIIELTNELANATARAPIISAASPVATALTSTSTTTTTAAPSTTPAPPARFNTPDRCLITRTRGKSTADAGFAGITALQCANLGGCFDNQNAGPWCYKPDATLIIPTNNSPSQCEQTRNLGKSGTDAGFSGISQDQCQLVGACFDTSNNGPLCFASNPQ